MKLQYICANRVRAEMPVSDEPFLALAAKGNLDDGMAEIVTQATKDFGKKLNLDDLEKIDGILFPGALCDPDSMPSDAYGQNEIAVLCSWQPSATTAKFQMSDLLDMALTGWEALAQIESTLARKKTAIYSDTLKPVSLLVLSFYDQCAATLMNVSKTTTTKAEAAFVAAMDDTYFAPLKKQIQAVLAVENKEADGARYVACLGANLAIMQGLGKDMKVLLGA